MKKLLLSIVAVLSIVTASAQNFSWGIKAGTNTSSLSGKNIEGVMYKADFVGGVFGEYKTCDWFGVSAELLYSGQGSRNTNANENSKDYEYLDLAYLNVPILANFYVTKNISLKTGLQPGFLLSSKIRGNSVDISDNFEKFNLSVPVAIAFQLNCGLLFDLRYNIDVTKLNKEKADNNVYNSVIALTVGWRF